MKRLRWLIGFVLLVMLLTAATHFRLRAEQRQFRRNRALMTALVHDDLKQALVLVNAGADPNTRYQSPDNLNAFMIACVGGNQNVWSKQREHQDDVQLVQAMLAHGADVQARSSLQQTALHFAVYFDRHRTTQLLLDHGAAINAMNWSDTTPLLYAVKNANRSLVRLLLAQGANVNAQDTHGNTPLHNALLNLVDANIVRQLLAQGADPHRPNKSGETPLRLAQQINRPDLVFLLGKGRK